MKLWCRIGSDPTIIKGNSEMVAELPPTVQQWVERRKGASTRSLTDLVEDIHLKLINSAGSEYVQYLATFKDSTPTGDPKWDDYEAAKMVKQYAHDTMIFRVAEASLKEVDHHLKLVLRRYNSSRSQRRQANGAA